MVINVIILMDIGGYYITTIDDYCIINYFQIFNVIISYVIGSYYIIGYF